MAVVNEAKTVKPEALEPRTKALVETAAVEELARSKKRIAELEGQLVTRRGVGFRLTQLLGSAVALAAVVLALVAAVAAGHRLLLWGWP